MRKVFWSAVLGLAGLSACGGDGGSGSGVARGTLLLEISDDDAVALCDFSTKLNDGAFASASAYCTYYAHDDDAESCQEEVQDCLDAQDYAYDQSTVGDCSTAEAVHLTAELNPACKATVADYEACQRTLARLQRASASSATCDGRYSVAEDAEYDERNNPTVCEKLADCYEDY